MPKKIGKSEKNVLGGPFSQIFCKWKYMMISTSRALQLLPNNIPYQFYFTPPLPKSNFMQRNSIGNRRKMSNILKKLGDLNACTSELNARLDWQNDSFLTLSSLWLDLFVIIIIKKQRLLFKLFSLISLWGVVDSMIQLENKSRTITWKISRLAAPAINFYDSATTLLTALCHL